MKLLLITTLAIFAFAGCKQKARTVLVTGDSWGFFVCVNKSLDKALQSAGIQDTASNSTCAVTSNIGMRAADWAGSTFDKAAKVALLDPSVKVLYISLGGNDIKVEWKKSMTPSEEQALFTRIRENLTRILDEYKKIRPDVKFIVSGYDYPRFTADHPVRVYREVYENMGKPTPYELNSALARFSSAMTEIADQQSVFYIHHLGLMHYHYGHRESGLAPRTTLAPELISSPTDMKAYGGDLNLQADPKALVTIAGENGVVDAFHLSKSGYERLADHVVLHYLKDLLSR